MDDLWASVRIRELEEELADANREIKILKAQVEELEHGHLKKENKQLRHNLMETNKNLVEVCNENLELRRIYHD